MDMADTDRTSKGGLVGFGGWSRGYREGLWSGTITLKVYQLWRKSVLHRTNKGGGFPKIVIPKRPQRLNGTSSRGRAVRVSLDQKKEREGGVWW